MAESLGEKLRQAREARDITISEVAEQTRISALYLEAIEKDDYRTLPGGIFNKGFVKSFAKYVGVEEDEALQDYARIVASQETDQPEQETRSYRPEVLTDDSRSGSMLPTIIFAVLILGLISWGVLALVKYIQSQQSSVTGTDSIAESNTKPEETPSADANSNAANSNTAEPLPSTESIKLKLSTSADELAITSMVDGKRETVLLTGDIKEREFDAEESVKISYYKGSAEFVNLELNGKKIATPMPPENYRKNGFEYEINMSNLKQILQEGKIVFADPSASPAPSAENANTAPSGDNANVGNAQ
ncbi:MAG: helix-turn-helix domain-containing protein [Pyrinomonadaceae bacterium]